MQKKIVVVEDEPVIAEMIRFMLEEEGYEVIAFNSKAGVMAELAQRPVALVLLDIALGQQDGLDICDDIKSVRKEIPVILMSAHRDLEKIAGECGADGFILKPFELSGFAGSIRAFIH